MRLLLDEHFPLIIAQQLRSRRHDVVTAEEAGVAGVDDSQVLAVAVANGQAVATKNIQDFRPLHDLYLKRGAAHYGIVLVPSRKYSLKRDHLGPIIGALDELLVKHGDDNDLCDREYFL